MSGLFISYRRSDTEGYAGRIFERCKAHFGAESVFFDVDDIAPGEDFVKVIEQHVVGCDALLVLIGQSWVDARAADGSRRLDDPNDFVRLEIAAALRKEVMVVPVLLQGATMPAPTQLPDDLAALSHLNAVELRHIHWDSDFQSLLEALDRRVRRPARSRRRVWYGIAAAVALMAVIGGLRFWMSRIEVPNVTGMPIDAAEAILTYHQFGFRIAQADQAGTGIGQDVIRQEPQAGSLVASRTDVTLTVTKEAPATEPGIQNAASAPDDLKQKVIGSWHVVRTSAAGFLDEIATYRADGSAEAKGKFGAANGQETPFMVSGIWALSGRTVAYMIVTSSVPSLLPVGFKGSIDILSITEKEMKIQDPNNPKTYIYSRVVQ